MLVNGRFLKQTLTGVQRVAIEMCNRIECEIIKCKWGRLSNLYEQIVFPFISKNNCLVSFCNIGPIFAKNSVVYIHDVAVLDYPKWFSRKFYLYYSFMLPLVAKNANKIITVSNFSKERIIERLNVDKDKVEVIYNGVSEKFFVERKKEITDKYILTVGTLEPRKNLRGVLEAWEKSDLKSKGYCLKVIGGSSSHFSSVYDSAVKSSTSVEFLGYVSEKQLLELYANASGFIYMSFYEGFGLPVIEAMAARVPVLTSSTTALGEISLKYCLNCEPDDVDKIGELLNLLPFVDLNEVEKANVFARTFDWEDAAAQLREVLNELEY